MFIAVDIGNTNVTVGALDGTQVVRSFKFETSRLRSVGPASGILKSKSAGALLKGDAVEAVYICSVVPALNKNARRVFEKVFEAAPKVLGEDVIVPIINRYRVPTQVGQDRLVNAYAGSKIYGNGLVIVDFGTAITFDILSRKSEYFGGLIFPGLKLMQEALKQRTALLPYVELAKPIEIIGRDTVSSIRAGIVYGAASLCDGIIERLLKKECRGYKVVATGGDASLVQPYSRRLSTIDDFLILKGLALIYLSQKLR